MLSVRLYSVRKIVSNQERLRELVSKDNRKQKYRWNKLKIYAELMTTEVGSVVILTDLTISLVLVNNCSHPLQPRSLELPFTNRNLENLIQTL